MPAELQGCRLCPVGWMLLKTKCYWLSDGMNPWNKSREDCGNRGSTLLMPWDRDELVKEMMGCGMELGLRPRKGSQNPGISAPAVSKPHGCLWQSVGDTVGLSSGMRTQPVLG